MIGAYDAKTRLSELLDLVARGERIVITRHGVPVAVLQQLDDQNDEAESVIRDLKRFRVDMQARGVSVGPDEAREWIREGRK